MDPQQQALSDITLQTGIGALATKFAVDMITMGWPNRPTWGGPVAAFSIGIIFVLLQIASTGVVLSMPVISSAILHGVVVGGLAMGLTASGNAAQAKRLEATENQPVIVATKKKKP